MGDTLSSQLSQAFKRQPPADKRGKDQNQQRQKVKSNLPHATNWIGDGEDHINLFYNALTDLGRTLHPNSILEFEHPLFGRFNSVSSFWDYIETGAKEQRLRFMGHSARRETKRKLETVRVPHLEYMILDACWDRIRSYPVLQEALKASELPFDLYRTEGKLNIPVRMNDVMWLVEGMELIRRALKNGQHPNFGRWGGGKTRKEIYDGYCELFIPNAKTKPKEVSQENQLLSKLRRNGPQLPQPKRKVPTNKGMMAAEVKAETETAPLETLVKVEVPELVGNTAEGLTQETVVETISETVEASSAVATENA